MGMNLFESEQGLEMAKKGAERLDILAEQMSNLPEAIQNRVYEAVLEAVSQAMEKTLVPLIQKGNEQRESQIEQSNRIEKIERQQLGVQTTHVYLQAKETGREADLGLTKEQLDHGLQNTASYFQAYASQSAMKEAEFERDMAELERSFE